MDGYALVRTVLAVFGAAFTGAALVFFAHGWWMVRYERRNAVRVERGRRALLDLSTAGRLSKAEAESLRALPRRLQVRLFVELASYLAGSQRRYLAAEARALGLVDAAERMCSARRWWVRLRGVRLLTVIGGGRGTVPAMFADPHPAVRAEAVEWAGEHAEDGEIERLLALLEDPARVGRYELLDSLLRIGPAVVGPLARYLETHGGEQAEPALEVAAGLPDGRFAAAAVRLCADALPAVRARAASLAGALGGDEAVASLETLLDDPVAEVRAAAAASLGRLGHWPAATRVAGLMRDSAWVVRSQSALALRRLGSPGLLLLRRGLGDGDRFAADIARQVLDMPDTTAERDQWR